MGQPRGKTGNPNGRPKGSNNKVTTEMRTWLANLIEGKKEQIVTDLESLAPKERLQMIEKFLQYTLPKLQSVEQDISLDHDLTAGLDRLNNDQIDTIIKTIVKSTKK